MARLWLVHDPNWWAAATIPQIGDTWQVADAYRGRQDADVAREVMTREVSTRWGVTPEANADSAAVRRLLEQVERDRQEGGVEDLHAEQDRNRGRAIEDEAGHQDRHAERANSPAELRSETVIGTDGVVEVEQAQAREEGLDQHSADGYDSAEQRQTRAEGYSKCGDQHATQARVLADEVNALPPVYATRARPGRRRRPARGPRQPRPYYRAVGDRGR